MNTRMIFKALVALGFALAPVTAARADHHMDTEGIVQKSVEHYVAISDALARDTVDGVAEHALALLEAMPAGTSDQVMHGEKGHTMHDGSMVEAHASMQGALKTLSASETNLERAREAFTDLSVTFVPMAQKHVAASGSNEDFVVVHCPMAPGDGDWIQADGKTANPFYGSKMLRCGTQLGALGAEETSKKLKRAEVGHGPKHDSVDHADHGHDH